MAQHHFSVQVSGFNHHVVLTQDQFLVELHAESALEHRVGEDVPLGVVGDASQACGGFTFARTVIVSGINAVVGCSCVSATEHLGVVSRERQVVQAPSAAFTVTSLQVQHTSGSAVGGQLHQQHFVAHSCGSLHVGWNHEPSTVSHSQFLTSKEVVVIHTNGPQAVVFTVLCTHSHPAVKRQARLHGHNAFVDVE